MKKSLIAMMMMVTMVLMVSSVAQAAVTSTFEVNIEGWHGDGGSVSRPTTGGSGDNGAWASLVGTVNFPSIQQTPATNTEFTGDLGAQHGDGQSVIKLSFDHYCPANV